jgi:hypothetical protein
MPSNTGEERLLFGGQSWGERRHAPLDPGDLSDVTRPVSSASRASSTSPEPPAAVSLRAHDAAVAVPEWAEHRAATGHRERESAGIASSVATEPERWPLLPDDPPREADWSVFAQQVRDRERREVRREQARL